MIPPQSPSVCRSASFAHIGAGGPAVVPAGPFDWLCKWFKLPWCDAPEETCHYDRTDTKCWGVVEMCKDRGWTASGKSCSSGWYACGICLGFPW